MVRAALGLTAPRSVPRPAGSLADAAWNAGLLPVPADSVQDVRLHLLRGEPVIALLDSRALPGHPPGEDSGDQPVLLIGTTPTSFIYSDPSFSSSLGYGLELSDADFQRLWDGAAVPRQAVALMRRPDPPGRSAHLAEAEPPAALARVTWTPTPVPSPTRLPPPPTRPVATAVPLAPTATPVPMAVQPTDVSQARDEIDGSRLASAGVSLLVLGAFVLRWLRHP
jgi:hypothetical protein